MRPEAIAESRVAIEESRTFLREAEALNAAGFPGPALRSALYAMEYAAQALLLLDGTRVHQDRAIVLAFAQRAAELDTMPAEAVGDLSLVLAARSKSDYDAGFHISAGDALWALTRARGFTAVIEKHLPETVLGA